MKSQSGFTLIEIIVSLVLVGILATLAGMGLVAGTKGYIFTKENTHMTQKVQLAMTRLNREILELINVTTATSSTLAYEGVDGNRTLGLNSGSIKIAGDGVALASGDLLIDQVNSFALTYYKGDQVWQSGVDSIQLLSSVKIDLEITRTDSGLGQISFSTTVNPRNNENYGGAAPTSSPPAATSGGGGCFVATATYGHLDHPSVRVLRQFRDRFLLTWEGGRQLVRFYYANGPVLADKIKNRPRAKAVARGLLAPLVGLAFVMLDFPLLIGGLLILSLLLTHGVAKHLRKKVTKLVPAVSGNQQGSLLIGLVITMVVFAALGAAMLPLTTTGTYNPIGANSSAKAYFLAESGYRYAASVFLHAGDDAQQEASLIAMHNQTYSLAGQSGQFQLSVYSYWFKTASAPSGRYLTVDALGAIPTEFSLTGGYLYINGERRYYQSATTNGNQITFRRPDYYSYWPSYTVGTACYPASRTEGSQTVSQGGNLNFDPYRPAEAFPQRNGRFSINGHIYQYRTLNLAANRLEGISDPELSSMPSFYCGHETTISLEKFVKLHSTGIVAQGGAMASSKEIAYHVPIGLVEGIGINSQHHDTFEDKTKWHNSAKGSHAIASVDGDNALHVTGDSAGDDSHLRVSNIGLDWDSTDVDLDTAWDDAGNYLSYDVQAKVRVDNEPYFMAGVSFRMDSYGNGFGVSFLRGLDGYPHDNIHNDLVPSVYQSGYITHPMIVLWRQWNNYQDKEWLAYSVLSSADHVFDSSSRLKDFSTIVVRIREGASVRFNSGGTTPIVNGETVTGQSSGATGIANGDAFVRYGSWAGGNAEGYIILTNRTGSFTSWETLLVNGENRATSTGYISRHSYIRVYYGDTSAHGTASTDPLDDDRLANERGEVNWPPSEVNQWTAETDHLTLVQWNSNVDGSIDLYSTATEPNGIIRTDDFGSPTSGSFTDVEVGLHTFGNTSDKIYFDDFAIRTIGAYSGTGFLPGLQE
jgi:prepilin-type N-terminal cleavage/methylation domain-containing protein